jgi:TrmH family RNA methyltransferase
VTEHVLSSHRNPRFRAALALRDARDRRQRRQILIDGGREIDRAATAGVKLLEAYVAPSRIEAAGSLARAALESARRSGAEIIEATPELVARLSYGDRDDGIVVVAEMPSARLGDLSLPAVPLIGVVEGLEKPGNLGAILRTADGAGLDALIVADPGTDPYNPNVIRASLGTVFSVPVAVASTGEVLEWLIDRGIRIVAARVDGSVDYTEVEMTGALAIALGSEARGLSDAWAELAAAAARVPMLGIADSLNVSATAAVLFYEAHRQRRMARRPRDEDRDEPGEERLDARP